MLNITIHVNGQTVYSRSARNIDDTDKINKYQCDDGSIIEHNPDDGIVLLAKKMLDTITET